MPKIKEKIDRSNMPDDLLTSYWSNVWEKLVLNEKVVIDPIIVTKTCAYIRKLEKQVNEVKNDNK